MAEASFQQDKARPASYLPVLVIVGLVLAGLAVLNFLGAGAADRLLDRSAIGVRALTPWLVQADIPARRSHPQFHPLVADLGLRVLPLYDLNIGWPSREPDTDDERLDQVTLRDISSESYFTKIAEIPTVVLLPKWRGAMVEPGIAHRRSLIHEARLHALLNQIGLKHLRVTRGGPTFTTHQQDGLTLALFHAQLFDPATLPDDCWVTVPFAQGALVIACQQDVASFPVTYVSDPDLMNNHGLGIADHARFVPAFLSGLRLSADMPIYVDTSPDLLTSLERFDEGYSYERGNDALSRFFTYPFTIFWAALLIVLASLFWRGTVRFGAVQPPRPAHSDKAQRAVVSAKARLLRLSGSDGHMVADFVRSELRELAAHSFGSDAIQNADQRFLALVARRDPQLARAFGDLSADLIQNAPTMSDAQLQRQLDVYQSLLKKVTTHYEPV